MDIRSRPVIKDLNDRSRWTEQQIFRFYDGIIPASELNDLHASMRPSKLNLRLDMTHSRSLKSSILHCVNKINTRHRKSKKSSSSELLVSISKLCDSLEENLSLLEANLLERIKAIHSREKAIPFNAVDMQHLEIILRDCMSVLAFQLLTVPIRVWLANQDISRPRSTESSTAPGNPRRDYSLTLNQAIHSLYNTLSLYQGSLLDCLERVFSAPVCRVLFETIRKPRIVSVPKNSFEEVKDESTQTPSLSPPMELAIQSLFPYLYGSISILRRVVHQSSGQSTHPREMALRVVWLPYAVLGVALGFSASSHMSGYFAKHRIARYLLGLLFTSETTLSTMIEYVQNEQPTQIFSRSSQFVFNRALMITAIGLVVGHMISQLAQEIPSAILMRLLDSALKFSNMKLSRGDSAQTTEPKKINLLAITLFLCAVTSFILYSNEDITTSIALQHWRGTDILALLHHTHSAVVSRREVLLERCAPHIRTEAKL
eukprot:TRINITY_DN693_c0_g3_i2.p1 TRINITY_DN693_c0_g3~~TRINITY_DN693_c0_g3_i2.p1  ORF type:complete len:487 (+),score=77.63 TRINITY_DN693_c0_g3_i2:33-1493(+)